MSHFIFGPMVDNEPEWIQKHVDSLSKEELMAAKRYQDLIGIGYFPRHNIQEEWVSGAAKPLYHIQARAFSMRFYT